MHDIVTNEQYGAPIISGHYDKNVRFWDLRSANSVNSILLNDTVRSLFLSPGKIM